METGNEDAPPGVKGAGEQSKGETGMDVNLTWKTGLAFTGLAEENGYSLDLDAYKDVGGEESGFSPMQLLALGLGGCTATDVISILQKKRQDVKAFQVQVHTERAGEHPRVWTQAMITYIITGAAIDPAAVERAIQLSAEKYCPAQNMLKQAVQIQHEYKLVEG
jgi:putative redox protein